MKRHHKKKAAAVLEIGQDKHGQDPFWWEKWRGEGTLLPVWAAQALYATPARKKDAQAHPAQDRLAPALKNHLFIVEYSLDKPS
jgi:hypothetical protein